MLIGALLDLGDVIEFSWLLLPFFWSIAGCLEMVGSLPERHLESDKTVMYGGDTLRSKLSLDEGQSKWSSVQQLSMSSEVPKESKRPEKKLFFYLRFRSTLLLQPYHTVRNLHFLSKNSILTKPRNPQHFHEFFTKIFFDNFFREIKVVNS